MKRGRKELLVSIRKSLDRRAERLGNIRMWKAIGLANKRQDAELEAYQKLKDSVKSS